MADKTKGLPVAAGYLDIHAKTDGLVEEIGDALGTAAGEANSAGQKIGSELEEGSKKKTQGLGQRLMAWGGFASIGAAVGTLFKSGWDNALTQADMERTMAANLGISPQQAAQYADVAADLYAQGWGESLEEVGTSVQSMLSEVGDISKAELEELAPLLMGIAEQTGADMARLADATNKMVVTGLAGSVTEAADIVAKAYQSFGESSGEDILDTLTEYSGQFQKLGIDAETAMGMVKQAMDAGARNTDFVADALKEFSIRSIDQTKATMEAYDALGLSGEEMTKRLAAGGPDAAAAMQEIFSAVNSVGDAAKKEQISVALFGTKAEDLGKALSAMDPKTAAKDFGDFAGTAQEMADASMSLDEMLGSLGRTLTMAIADTIRPILPQLREFLSVIVGAFGFLRDNPIITTILFSIAAAIALMAAGQVAFNVAMMANPMVLIIMGILAAIGLLVAALAWATDGFTNWGQLGVGILNSLIHGVNGLIHALNGVLRALEAVLSLGGMLGDWNWGNIGTIDLAKLPGQAGGGHTTKPGLSWVGEEGPELMYMSAGANIVPNDVSELIASGGGKQPTSVTIINPVAEKGSRSLSRYRSEIGDDLSL